MKFYLFDTPAYTKHSPTDGKLILSRNGAHLGAPGSLLLQQQTRFAQAAIAAYGTKGRVNWHGKKISAVALKIASDPNVHGSLGGDQRREEIRAEKHNAAMFRWGNIGNFTQTYQGAPGFLGNL